MNINMIYLAFLFSFVLTSYAASLPQRTTGGIVRVPLSRRSNAYNSSNERRRDGTSLPQAGGAIYFIIVQIGTPLQSVYVQLDTGSNELWVDPDCATSSNPAACDLLGNYNPTKSSTSIDKATPFVITYGEGSVSGTYYTDTILLADASLPSTQFGIGISSSYVNAGIMGVSFGFPYNTDYNNVVDQLAANGKINSKLFSLALGSVTTAAGEIVFGGLDTMKYSGSLTQVPIIFPGPDKIYRYWVSLKSVGNTQPGTSTSKPYTPSSYSLDVILDSGTTLSYIPQSLLELILPDFPGATLQSNGQYIVSCSYATQSGTIDFGFGTVIISVPYSQFIWQPEPGSCFLGFIANPPSITIPILGDSFLRGAYVVYDQSQRSVYLANYVNCGSEVVAVPAGPGAAAAFNGQCSSPVTTYTSSSSSTISSTKSSSSSSTTMSSTASSLSQTSSTTKSSSSTSISSPPPYLLPTVGCHQDNCLRALENQLYASSAYAYCHTFLATSVPTASTLVPTYLNNCGPTSIIAAISSACPCFVAEYVPSTKSMTSTTTTPASPTHPLPTQGCHQDNCLRALENQAHELSAYTYCKSFLATSVPTASTSGIPTYLANCGPTTTVAALSSACPCFLATYTL